MTSSETVATSHINVTTQLIFNENPKMIQQSTLAMVDLSLVSDTTQFDIQDHYILPLSPHPWLQNMQWKLHFAADYNCQRLHYNLYCQTGWWFFCDMVLTFGQLCSHNAHWDDVIYVDAMMPDTVTDPTRTKTMSLPEQKGYIYDGLSMPKKMDTIFW